MPTTPAKSVDWASRPVLTAMSPPELAALVDRRVSRTEEMLFTATPTEELDAIGQWQRARDLAFAGMMREIVAAYNRAEAEAREFAPDEIGLAIGATTTTGGNLLAQALSLGALPGLLEAVESGMLTERHALAVLRELDRVELTLEQRQAVVLLALGGYRGQTPGELGSRVVRLIVTVDRAAAAARDAKATRQRKIWFSRDVDGQACMLARGPAAAIAAIRASLEATLPLDTEPGDDRSRDAREFDLAVALLTGGADAANWHAEVIVPFSTAQGGDLELAEIPGLGPILPATARDLLAQCDTLGQTAVNQHGQVIAASDLIRARREPTSVEEPTEQPADEPVAEPTDEPAEVAVSEFRAAPDCGPGLDPQLLRKLAQPPTLTDLDELTGDGYRFPPRLRRYLEARDRTCVFPGCGRPARCTDKDHRKPWPAGATSAHNGQCLCRHHHRAKHTVFIIRRQPDGTYLWITRGRWRFKRRPKGF